MSKVQDDKEISASAELTPTGAKVIVRSWLAAMADRLGGNWVDQYSVPIETRSAELRALSEARIKTIQSAGEQVAVRAASDPEFASRILGGLFQSEIERQTNKGAVVDATLEDLRARENDKAEPAPTYQIPDDRFLNRFERYAEEATDEEVRARWARVLSQEIRKPKTFSNKVLRVIDEMDSYTADIFERFCQYRIGEYVPRVLVNRTPLSSIDALISSGLISSIRDALIRAIDVSDRKGSQVYIFGFDRIIITVSGENIILLQDKDYDPVISRGVMAIPIYTLTDVGIAISSIIADNSQTAAVDLIGYISEKVPSATLELMEMPLDDGNRRLVATVGPIAPRGPTT